MTHFNYKICPLTNIQVYHAPKILEINRAECVRHSIFFNERHINIILCISLAREILLPNSNVSSVINPIRAQLMSRWIRNNFKEIENIPLHWNCPEIPDNHRNLSEYILTDDCNPDSKFTRKDKLNLIERFIYKRQRHDGDKVWIDNSPVVWGEMQLQSFYELKMYLDVLEKKRKIRIIDENNVQMTLEGIEEMELLSIPDRSQNGKNTSYDIALSFAGEQRPYVEKVAAKLKELHIKVFYDDYEEDILWGKDLYQHLNSVYKDKCQFCIVFISKQYGEKVWTRHELKSAQARAIEENIEYILPVKFDDTELPGINKTIAYINANDKTPEEIAVLADKKLKQL